MVSKYQDSSSMVIIAKVGAPYHLKGQLKLHPLSESIEKFFPQPWFIKKIYDCDWNLMLDKSINKIGNKWIIKFSDTDVREIASKYTNALLAVPRSSLQNTNENEYYWIDLIGMDVINKDGDPFGKVIRMIETGSNDVLCCKYKKSQYLIPFIKDYVINVDTDKKLITVDWNYDY